jgi:hypothetical protein
VACKVHESITRKNVNDMKNNIKIEKTPQVREHSVSCCTVILTEVLLTFPNTVSCKVDIDKCVKLWDNNFWSISQWNDEYTLVKVYDSDNYGKCKISKQQAHELIGKLNLVDEKSPIFNSGKTWRQLV